jgi:hypothetical protein
MNKGTTAGTTRPQGPLYQELAYQLSHWYTQYMPS